MALIVKANVQTYSTYSILHASLSLSLSPSLPLTSLFSPHTHTSTVTSDVVNYYIVCNESCVSSPFQESYDNATQAFQLIPAAETTIREYIDNQNMSELLVGDWYD